MEKLRGKLLESPSQTLEQARSGPAEDISIGEPVRKRRLMNPQAPIN